MCLLFVSSCPEKTDMVNNLFSQEFKVIGCSSGRSALKAALKDDIDVILIDANVNDMTALEMCKFIQRNPLTQNIPFLVMSHNPTIVEEETALLLGAADYFPSDVTPLILFSRVKTHMDLIHKHRELELISSTDGLTGLANRTQFDTTMRREWHSALRGGYPIAVIMVDIDEFKLYNDTFGHLQGDECLRKVALAVELSKRRDEDLACRFGGEEFILILPFTDIDGARQVASTLLQNVTELYLVQAKKAQHPAVSVSAGIAVHTPSMNDQYEMTPEDLIEKADASLYKAKNNGRNRWC
ncbi:diguanylate cyclase [Aliiglaciecola sp. LCG003]|uniref:GGDEF domain-containing response regulator n=1 Tax=Aliiglaciecola sp. LCG003 TaxID=3053655 RepID=UPI0025733648|nr:diguanylate cyclase [Aliiglaciecola sp. LCG003]WJG11033.1 diguanylate cyclase [Aliiglaciecola sp. LCG003]